MNRVFLRSRSGLPCSPRGGTARSKRGTMNVPWSASCRRRMPMVREAWVAWRRLVRGATISYGERGQVFSKPITFPLNNHRPSHSFPGHRVSSFRVTELRVWLAGRNAIDMATGSRTRWGTLRQHDPLNNHPLRYSFCDRRAHQPNGDNGYRIFRTLPSSPSGNLPHLSTVRGRNRWSSPSCSPRQKTRI